MSRTSFLQHLCSKIKSSQPTNTGSEQNKHEALIEFNFLSSQYHCYSPKQQKVTGSIQPPLKYNIRNQAAQKQTLYSRHKLHIHNFLLQQTKMRELPTQPGARLMPACKVAVRFCSLLASDLQIHLFCHLPECILNSSFTRNSIVILFSTRVQVLEMVLYSVS